MTNHQDTLPPKPCRIVCMAPSNTEILYALGAEDRIAGVTRFCDYPSAARRKPRVGGFSIVDIEKIIACQPDLVLASTFLQKDLVAELINRDLAVLTLNPVSLEGILDDIWLVGNLVGRAEKAQEIIADIRAGFEDIAKTAATFRRTPKVYCEEWGDRPILAGDWVPEMIDLAGGVNAFADWNLRVHSVGRMPTDAEVIERNPDIILLSWCGFKDRSRTSDIAKRPGWDKTEAVKNGHVYAVDDRFVMRPGPRIVEGAKRIQQIIAAWQSFPPVR